MPYNADGTKKKNPTPKDWRRYQAAKSSALRRSASNQGGASVGGGT